SGWATAIGLFLLLAACGKSAQFPLQGWLLDAMEGPTPVSALIHAATMVTAGVYLIVRSHAVYEHTPFASMAVVIIGTVTLLLGAWIGSSKDDIKKVLAGSTMSQIGYMILAAGIGGPALALAIFHLLTHGFFKANMFLGAGSVMHAMDDDVNMRHYGALRKELPITHATFLMGYMAIIGVPGWAGYFSKDLIIDAAVEFRWFIGALAIAGAGITAFYMTRLMFMTWWGKARWRPGVHPHESPKVMTWPLVILAFFSVVGGMLMFWWIQTWLQPLLGYHETMPFEPFTSLPGWATLAVVVLGVVLGWYTFGRPEVTIPIEAPKANAFVTMGRNDAYADAIMDVAVVQPYAALGRGIVGADAHLVDAGFMGMGTLLQGVSESLRKLQTGYVRTYALTMTAGVLLVGLVMILSRMG
ncbi:MAG TPA: NADH-quinone oxidoreductase subunit L, partial [Propionibacteriaceae bacterium]|nr:NADH-quinone oxidoreductase subunit L [Propionibacteriaceae bacterium]